MRRTGERKGTASWAVVEEVAGKQPNNRQKTGPALLPLLVFFDSCFPISGLSTKVHDCDNLNLISFWSVDQAVWKPKYTALTDVTLNHAVEKWVFLDPLSSVADSCNKTFAQS